MAKGADLSHWQTPYSFSQVLKWAEFVALNACDGSGFRDPAFPGRWRELGFRIGDGTHRLVGRIAYIFLEPGNGSSQADLLLKTVPNVGPHARYALDWESRALSYPGVLTAAANRIFAKTKQHPLVYTSSSQYARAKAAAPNCPMWLADWTPPFPPNWQWTFLQYQGIGLDLDEFDGDHAALKKFFGWDVAPPPPPPPTEKHWQVTGPAGTLHGPYVEAEAEKEVTALMKQTQADHAADPDTAPDQTITVVRHAKSLT